MKKLLIVIFISIGIILINCFNGFAQERNYFIYLTWKAETISELDFEGKNFPIESSKVYLQAQIFNKNGFKVDPSQFIFSWKVDYDDQFFDCLEGKFFLPRAGRNKICFIASKPSFLPFKVEVVIQNQGYFQKKEIEIPFRSPEIIIVPFGRKNYQAQVPLKKHLSFYLKKFYFSTFRNLRVDWYLDNKKPQNFASNPFKVDLEFYSKVEKGRKFELRAECFSLNKKFERAQAEPVTIFKE